MTSLSALANAHAVIGKRWSQDLPTEQAQVLALARDALDCIFATGQRYGFEDFFKRPGARLPHIESTGQQEAFSAFQQHVEANAPPFIMAAFATRQDAEAWLANHPQPPDPANVLIANEYHDVFHNRETGIRRLPRNRALEWYLTELEQKEPPVAVASFETRGAADAWWRAQPESVRRAWVRVGGELFFAAYYPHIHHRTLFPLPVPRRA